MSRVVIIPFDYEELPSPKREQVIPICIPLIDPRGHEVPRIWFEAGVAPIHQRLVSLAEWQLGDAWRVSELAEATIHALFARHGADAGEWPWRRVLREAAWVAKDLHAGGTRADRNRRAAEVSFDEIDTALLDPINYGDLYERGILIDSLKRKLEREGRAELSGVLILLQQGYTWPEIAGLFGYSSEDVLKRRFYRSIRKYVDELSNRVPPHAAYPALRQLHSPGLPHVRGAS